MCRPFCSLVLLRQRSPPRLTAGIQMSVVHTRSSSSNRAWFGRESRGSSVAWACGSHAPLERAPLHSSCRGMAHARPSQVQRVESQTTTHPTWWWTDCTGLLRGPSIWLEISLLDGGCIRHLRSASPNQNLPPCRCCFLQQGCSVQPDRDECNSFSPGMPSQRRLEHPCQSTVAAWVTVLLLSPNDPASCRVSSAPSRCKLALHLCKQQTTVKKNCHDCNKSSCEFSLNNAKDLRLDISQSVPVDCIHSKPTPHSQLLEGYHTMHLQFCTKIAWLPFFATCNATNFCIARKVEVSTWVRNIGIQLLICDMITL